MVLIEYYLVFATVTALVILFGMYTPIIAQAKQKGIDNVLTKYYLLGCVVFFGVSFVLAPFVFVAMVIPERAVRLRAGLQNILEADD